MPFVETGPPVDLSVVVTRPDGLEHRFGSEDHDPARVPTDITFSTQRMEGFASGGVSLRRRVDQDIVDIGLLDTVTFVGHEGSIAYEGRVGQMPRSLDSDHRLGLQLAGWMAHANDRPFREIYIDQDMARWGEPSVQRRINLLAASRTAKGATTVPDDTTGQPSIAAEITGPWGATSLPVVEATYSSQGVDIGSVYFAWKKTSNVLAGDANWLWFVRTSTDDIQTAISDTGNLRAAGPDDGVLAAVSGAKYAILGFQYQAASGASDTSTYSLFWTDVAVYGTSGITRYGTADPGGYYASDIITNIAQRWCPELNTAGVTATTYPIPHMVFLENTLPYEAFKRVNAYHLWDLAVWENKTLHYGPVDLSDWDWEIRTSDHGTTVELQGDTTEQLANGIVLTYTDVATGKQFTLTPDDHSELADTAFDNPANLHGLNIWTSYTLSFPTTQDAALQIGRAALAEYNQPKAPGTITARWHVRDRAGNWQPVWKVRAGDRVVIADHPNDRPRLIQETSYDHASKTVRIAVEGTFRRLDAYIDRVNTALEAAGLT